MPCYLYKYSFLALIMLGFSTLPTANVKAQAAGAVANGVPQALTLDNTPPRMLDEAPEPASEPSVPERLLSDSAIGRLIAQGNVKGIDLKDAQALKTFYKGSNFKPVWVDDSLFAQLSPAQKKANAILSILQESWRHGLNPAHYYVEPIKTLLGGEGGTFALENVAALDVLLSDALIRYGQDMSGMRVEARKLDLHPRYWRKPMDGLTILNIVKGKDDIVAALHSFHPVGTLYESLQRELEKLYHAPVTDEETPVRLKGILRPGDSHEVVSALRQRMGVAFDTNDPAHLIYDEALAESVRAFQKAHGLKPDGILGRQTLAVMNKTRDDRINQVLVNLERLRWLNQEKPERYVVVNVPAARLWAIEEGKIAFDMKVVVGRYERQTNIFNTEITGVRFNPTWTVPPTIKEEDFLPELQSDPMYLAERGIEVVYNGNTIDPTVVDWLAINNNDLHGIQMVQPPGRANPLGRVRVFMPNPYNIYLHDTNKRSYFSRSDRALSSGCVRMEDAEKLAYFVMKNNDGWSEEKMNRILASGKKTDITAQEPVPVYLLYQTIWFGDNGQLVYGHDIYDRDIILRRALADMDAVGYPEVMQVSVPAIPKAPRKISPPKRVKQVKKKQEQAPVVEQETDNKPGSLTFFSGRALSSKKKDDGVDLLTFNE